MGCLRKVKLPVAGDEFATAVFLVLPDLNAMECLAGLGKVAIDLAEIATAGRNEGLQGARAAIDEIPATFPHRLASNCADDAQGDAFDLALPECLALALDGAEAIEQPAGGEQGMSLQEQNEPLGLHRFFRLEVGCRGFALPVGQAPLSTQTHNALARDALRVKAPDADADLAIGINVAGLDAQDIPRQGIVRLGAEGRLANWQRKPALAGLQPKRPAQANGLVLLLQTHALFAAGWLPDGFSPIKRKGQTLWQGQINDITLRIVCAVTGKPVREGGWDLVNHCPRALQSLVQAGSCYFCEVDGDLAQTCQALNSIKIGQEQEYGRGELVAGYW